MKTHRIVSLVLSFLTGGLIVLVGTSGAANAAGGCSQTVGFSSNQRTLTITCANSTGAYSYQPSLLCGTNAVRFFGDRIMQGSSTARCPAGAADRGSYWSSARATASVTTTACPAESDRQQWYSPTSGWVTKAEGAKVTCSSSVAAVVWYRPVVNCELAGTLYGPWVTKGVKSQVWCPSTFNGFGYKVDRAASLGAQYRR